MNPPDNRKDGDELSAKYVKADPVKNPNGIFY